MLMLLSMKLKELVQLELMQLVECTVIVVGLLALMPLVECTVIVAVPLALMLILMTMLALMRLVECTVFAVGLLVTLEQRFVGLAVLVAVPESVAIALGLLAVIVPILFETAYDDEENENESLDLR